METLGQRISKLRKEKGLTQEELANKFNITTTHIRRIVKNECWKF